MHQPARREVLTTLALGATALVGRRVHAAPPPVAKPAAPASGPHPVVPLPFAPGALRGLSERLITSHHENNYGGAVKNLNKVEGELAQLKDDAPPFVVAALREKELTFRNSKTLHEAYFGNLGGDGKRSGPIDAALGAAFGSAAKWEQQFVATGLGLSGGSGWVTLALELDTGALRIASAGNHTQALATGVPLLVMDMYEHSYQLDYGAAAAKYVEAFFANVNWEVVNRRLERAQRISAAWRAAG